MATHWPKPGVNHVGEYQASGHTFVVTGSDDLIKLKYVASSISVTAGSDASAANRQIKFYSSDHVGDILQMPTNSTIDFKGKFLTFEMSTDLSALISITNIPSASYNPPSGSMYFHSS